MDKEPNACVKESRPDFLELLNAFRNELGKMDESASIIRTKVRVIKDTGEQPSEKPAQSITENGILGELWECVHTMEKMNDILNESKNTLIQFVG